MTSLAPLERRSPPAAPSGARAAAPLAPRRPRWERPLALAPALVLLVLAWQWRWVNEDGFIYLRVVENLLAGDGPVFNPGERVEAYTGPAWLALLAAASAVLPGVALEHLAVVLGIAATVSGLGLATFGARRLLGDPPPGSVVLPLGAVVVVALPPFWDYASAALETGLALLWLGGSFHGVTRRRASLGLAFAIGLGPLVRPDLAVFAAGFLLVVLLHARRGGEVGGAGSGERSGGPGRLAALVLAAGLLPVAYQVFRMGYFATLLPNTALAKEPGLPFWSRGVGYLGNVLVPYALPLPLALLAPAWWRRVRGRWGVRGGRVMALELAVPVACGLLHALYVVRLGGDYMHARMLLPSVFAVLCPVMVVAVARRRTPLLLAALVLAWALVCAAFLRAPASRDVLVFDQRRAQLTAPGHPHPVTLADHRPLPWSQPWVGDRLARLARERPGSLVTEWRTRAAEVEGRRIPVSEPKPLAGVRTLPAFSGRVVVWTGSLGRAGYAAGPEVFFADRFGLADPIAGRLRLEPPRTGRPGHEKSLELAWVLARFADPATVRPDPRASPEAVAAARAALGCGDLARVLEGVRAPLDRSRFLSNVGVAWQTRSLRVADDPVRARSELCRAQLGGAPGG